jgi:hypothetical protein
MFKIENGSDGQGTILRLSGRIQSEHLEELKAQVNDRRLKATACMRVAK